MASGGFRRFVLKIDLGNAEAEDEQHDGHQVDERKDDQDKPGYAVERGGCR